MPELPEVETTLRGIEPHIIKKTVVKAIVRAPKLRWPIPKELNDYISGFRLLDIQRRAKYLLFKFEHGWMIVHLGMTGSFSIITKNTPHAKHDHMDILFSNGIRLRYTDPRKFGAILWTFGDPSEHKLLKNLGPEPLSPQFNTAYLAHSCQNRKTSIKTHLMNQKTVVGIGNIYASEALFKAGIHPERAASKISKERLAKLVRTSKQTLRAAIKKGGTTLQDFKNPDGSLGYFSIKLKVYGKEGNPCPKCRKPIKSKVIGQRNSFYCTNCQK